MKRDIREIREFCRWSSIGQPYDWKDELAMQLPREEVERQLEALVRLSESLAKMRLDSEVQSEDVTEALRLFKVSTMAANTADQNNLADTALVSSLSGPNREEMQRTESFLRTRLTMGMMINKQKLIEEAAGQGFNAVLVTRALSVMTSRGELLERNQGRLLKRIK